LVSYNTLIMLLKLEFIKFFISYFWYKFSVEILLLYRITIDKISKWQKLKLVKDFRIVDKLE